jgi:shikimate dehydrogenase
MPALRLGLIGDNIARSHSPLLHRLAGRMCGLDVSYDALIPADLKLDFDAVFERCRGGGYRGINITYPYKEQVVAKLAIIDPTVRLIGACNTVVFDGFYPVGLNTDYTGFIDAFRGTLGEASPGVVALVGAGGAGRAAAFALAELKAKAIRVFDLNAGRAERLANSLASHVRGVEVVVSESVREAATGADGLMNCTPAGMIGHGGTAIPKEFIGGQRWAFDAVYTPVETEFLTDARGKGLSIMSGYELFLHQGINAFRIFAGRDVDLTLLRRMMLDAEGETRRIA